jgi:hypothetical protein
MRRPYHSFESARREYLLAGIMAFPFFLLDKMAIARLIGYENTFFAASAKKCLGFMIKRAKAGHYAPHG